MTETPSQASNFIVVVHGRGVLQTCIAKGTLEEVTERAEAVLLSGFEIHVYSLKLATSNRPSYLVAGIDPLQQEFNMWDAEDEFKDLAQSIVNNSEEHTKGMAQKYIRQCIDDLTEELNKLAEGSEHIQPSEPTFKEKVQHGEQVTGDT
jgi:hypothetical protein